MNCISQHDRLYPSALRTYLNDHAPHAITARGNLDILHAMHHRPLVALFCSIKCSEALVLQTYAFAHALRDVGVTVVSGFHSPMEKECLTILLQGTQPVIYCPARSIEGFRLHADWRAALDQGRLLLLSPFAEKQRRPTTNRAKERNQLVAALADVIFVTYADPAGKTERFCRDILTWGKPLLTLDNSENAGLFAIGAKPLQPDQLSRSLLSVSISNPS